MIPAGVQVHVASTPVACSHRVTSRSLAVVQRCLMAQRLQALVQ